MMIFSSCSPFARAVAIDMLIRHLNKEAEFLPFINISRLKTSPYFHGNIGNEDECVSPQFLYEKGVLRRMDVFEPQFFEEEMLFRENDLGQMVFQSSFQPSRTLSQENFR